MPSLAHDTRAAVMLSLAAASMIAACSDPTGVRTSRAPDATGQARLPGFNGRIRIGVVPSAQSVAIGSADPFIVRDKVTGARLLHSAPDQSGDVVVTLESAGTTSSSYRLQVACTGNAAFRDDWVTRSEAAGYVTYVEFVATANCWRLYIGSLPTTATVQARDAFKSEVVARGLAGADAFWRVVTISGGSPTLRVASGGTVVTTPNAVVLESSSGLVRIGGATYRGVAEVAVVRGATLAGINELPIEQYLWGVVPRELPPGAFPGQEAQKAQAVAARTYALANLGKRAADGYDLLATTADQVYGGVAAEDPRSTAAVHDTWGIVATAGGELISALYFSTSGGYTANNEDAFSSAPLRYLRSVIDPPNDVPFDPELSLEAFKRYPTPTDLRDAASIAGAPVLTRYHRWVVRWSQAEITQIVSTSVGRPVGAVWHVDVVERAGSGRAQRVRYVTPVGTFFATKDAIRSSLQYLNPSGVPTPLLSTLFFIEPEPVPETDWLTDFVAYGGGWGHGVGMSQTGAVAMAARGASYEQILMHYYHGIELERWY